MGKTYKRNQSFRPKHHGRKSKKFDRWDKGRKPSREDRERDEYMPYDPKYDGNDI
ncbi:MAG TPA: hypothetical protein PKX15_02385 [Bacteroidales bacterium]|nr:hypothetical protein [Bacteroidales bacterium]